MKIFTQDFLNHIAQSVMIADASGQLQFQNTKAQSLLNFLASTDIMQMLKKEFELFEKSVWPKDLTLAHEFVILRKETDLYQNLFLKINVIPQCDFIQDGVLFLITDVTESHQEDLLKQEFLTLISHKLRTPIVALSYAMNLMLRRKELGFSEEEVDDFLNQAYLKSFEISELIEKMIRYCSVNKDKLCGLQTGVLWKETLEESVKRYDKKYKGYRIPYFIRIFSSLPDDTSVAMHKEYVYLIIENLIDNAIKFKATDSAILEVKCEVRDHKLHVTFEDNGPGIPPEFQHDVFLPFFQIEKYFSGAVEGVGLGLTVVKKILEAYGEKLEMTSVLDQGTKIMFTLPLVQDTQ